MATGKLKSWNGESGWIVSNKFDEEIFFDIDDLTQNYEPNIGDQLSFKVKKVRDKQTKSKVLQAKKVKYSNFNYAMNPHERKGRQLAYNIVVGFLSLIVISITVILAYVFLVK